MLLVESPLREKNKSIAFYTKLGFEISQEKDLYLAKESRFIVLLNPASESQPALRVFGAKETKSFLGPSGTLIHLVREKCPYSLGSLPSILGNYHGVSLETDTLQDSFTLWHKLGFKGTFSSTSGWIELNNAGQQLSIQKTNLCPHSFFNPSLTFFNGQKNKGIIDHIKQVELPIEEEVIFSAEEKIAQNIILKDPGGLGFFIFNDG
ncbi:hypothetical protein N8333_01640 [Flavobacteriaceae bacterium]|nr:hypothetical protein [Flavobacteriaceae bacterium]